MGDEKLTIGLWVGAEAAPNNYATATEQYEEMLDEPEGTVKSRIRAGLRRMRTELVGAGLGVDL